MSATTIRPATCEDAAKILSLLATVELPTADLNDSSWAHFWIAEADGEMIGTVGLEPAPPFALLRSLGVREQFQGTGLGRRLLAEAERNANGLGVTQLGLITDSAAPYFRRHGFEPVARDRAPEALTATQQFREICPDSATLMLKSTG